MKQPWEELSYVVRTQKSIRVGRLSELIKRWSYTMDRIHERNRNLEKTVSDLNNRINRLQVKHNKLKKRFGDNFGKLD